MWVGQFGFSVIFPTIFFLWLGVWLQNRFGLGMWVLIVFGLLGLMTSVSTTRSCLRSLRQAAAEKFLGMSIALEKEILYIVTKTEHKNDIMSAIMKNAGLESKAKSIVFSLPVTDTAGLRLIED